ncbi:MAG: hypothetical protein FGM14_08015 [Flavobacteriales bacterium]|nr:hypothetical protein [Flavobacteriales bacterium]
MKSILFLVSVLMSMSVWSQQVSLIQENQTFTVGNKNAYVLSIPYASKIQIEEELKKYLKDFGKAKSSKGEYTVLLGKDKSISDKAFDIYARVMTAKDGSPIAVFAVDLGGAFMNSREHPNQSQGFEQSLLKFGKECASKAIDKEVETEKGALKALEKEQKSLEKELGSFEKDIENYNKRIKEAEKKISEIKAIQNKKKDAFKAQESKIESIEKKRKTLN